MYDLLEGIRVLDFSTWLFAPSASAVLADWGADVVKVEQLAAPDPARGLIVGGLDTGSRAPMVEFANRGKRSVALDVGTAGGRELLHRLVATADVFVTNVRTEATVRLGIDVDSLRAVNPRLICVRGTGYGQRGPGAARPAFDVAATWASGGAAYQSTRRDRDEPGFQPGSFGDIAGGLAAAGAVAAALVKLGRTGEPSVIDVALQGVGMWLMGYQVTMGALGALPAPHRHEGPPNPLVNAFRTRDGVWLYFALMQADRFWPSFCRHVGLPGLVADPRFADSAARMSHTDELTALLVARFAEQTLAEWEVAMVGFDGVWAPARSPAELADDPHARENGFVVDAADALGTFPVVASPAQFDGRPLGTVRPAPAHGEHTDEVLLELGLTPDELIAHKLSGDVL